MRKKILKNDKVEVKSKTREILGLRSAKRKSQKKQTNSNSNNQ